VNGCLQIILLFEVRNFIHHTIHKNTFWLSLQRCVYWEDQKTMIVSDLHFGKTGHFRKSGIAVPQDIFKEDLQRLFAEIQFHQPKQVIIVGDMFHSRENKEMNLFLKWRNDISAIEVVLVKGNHDILADSWYEKAGITVQKGKLKIGKFSFIHDMTEYDDKQNSDQYLFSGHIHPGVSVRSGIRQMLNFPCYYFGEKYAVLPAFSKFTGLCCIDPKMKDTVYAITDEALIKI
jgi:DNA ligase-associated metallophosphoesterase